jgi:ribosomal protein L11 methylase PrmA
MSAFEADPGSYRDVAGTVYRLGDRVLRTVRECAAEDFDLLRESGLLEELSADGRLVRADPVELDALDVPDEGVRYLLQHPCIPFISYPYEWSFAELKCAALHHLDVQLAALDRGLTLSDASAYNIQFLGVRPTFIDTLSFRRYRDGEFWSGYRQFCEQFLNPLLLRALLGVSHNSWYRGRFEGIATRDLRRLLPLRAYVSWRILIHVILNAALGSSDIAGEDLKALDPRARRLPLASFRKLLGGLRTWISGLEPADRSATYWRDYESFRTYTEAEAGAKKAFVARFVEAVGPAMVWDIGCNAGEFALAALDAGAGYVVGWDTDLSALDLAFARAQERCAAFTPLYGDAVNPTPAQGWAQAERRGWAERGPADAVLVLAVVHHLAIAHNVPLDKVVAWILSLAPVGVVEFVDKDDQQVQRLLSLRPDIFADYSLETFLAILTARARIVSRDTLAPGGRELIWFDARESQTGP